MEKHNKKILIISPYMSGFGGTETVIENLFDEYNKNKKTFDMKFISVGGYSNGDWLSKIKSKKIVWLSSNKLIRTLEYMFFLPFIIFKLIKNNNPDIVISTNPIMWTIAGIIKVFVRNNYKVVSWYHYSFIAKKVKKIMFKFVDYYLAISPEISDELELKGISNNKISVVYNPVLPEKKIIRKSTDNIKRFIYVGRVMLDGQKNLRFMLDSLSKLHGKWYLDVYGSGDIIKVKNYAKFIGIEKNINFHGFEENPWKNIEFADFLLLTSKYEGFGMVLAEAISYGVPCISSNCPVGPSSIINNDNGRLYGINDDKEFIQYLQKVLDNKLVIDDKIKIKSSINKFYIKNYYRNFCNIIDKL